MASIIGKSYKLGEVMDIIPVEIEANELTGATQVPVIVGDPGIGKSESIKALARKLNFNYNIYSLGALSYEQYTGLPQFVEEKIDPEYHVDKKDIAQVTDWTMAELIYSINKSTEKALKEGKRGLLVLLDDIHLVEPIVQKYLFEFFQNKTLQNYKLHKKAFLVGAMNGSDSAGLEGFFSAILDRMAIYNVEFDKDYWYKHVGFSLHPYIASFASAANDKYFVGADSTDGASPSPRSWTELSKVLTILEKNVKDKRDLNSKLEIIAESRVGTDARIEFMKHVKIFQKFNFEKILNTKDQKFEIPLDISDQILSAFIIRYMKTKEDADYLKSLLQKSLDKSTFISIFINEVVTIYHNIDSIQKQEVRDSFQYFADIITDPSEENQELFTKVSEAFTDIS